MGYFPTISSSGGLEPYEILSQLHHPPSSHVTRHPTIIPLSSHDHPTIMPRIPLTSHYRPTTIPQSFERPTIIPLSSHDHVTGASHHHHTFIWQCPMVHPTFVPLSSHDRVGASHYHQVGTNSLLFLISNE